LTKLFAEVIAKFKTLKKSAHLVLMQVSLADLSSFKTTKLMPQLESDFVQM